MLEARAEVTAANLERCCRLMNAAVPDCLVTGHESLIPNLSLPDPDDRHVLAAAIHAGAESIITFNLKDFPEDQTGPHGVSAIHPDTFLARLLDGFEHEVCLALRNQRGLLKNPPKTVSEHLTTLEKVGLVQSVALLRCLDDRL